METLPKDFSIPRQKLEHMPMTFTRPGLAVLKHYRAQRVAELGRTMSLGEALDGLLSSHPYMQDRRYEITDPDAPCCRPPRLEA